MRFCVSGNSTAIPSPNPHSSSLAAHPFSERCPCRTALLQQSDERLAALLTQWFECMIGDEGIDEELDDLCLLLDYRVQSWGAQISYATYTSWWEVEGYLEPSEGTFFCADVASLRKLLLDMPIKQFDLVVELAYQARSMVAELEGGARLPTGPALLREMTVWLAGAVPESARETEDAVTGVYPC